MERTVWTASVNIDALWTPKFWVNEAHAVEVDGQTLVRDANGRLRNLWFGEVLFGSREEATIWAADEIERHAGELAATAADLRRQAEVTV